MKFAIRILVFLVVGIGVYALDSYLVKTVCKKNGKGMIIGRSWPAKFITAAIMMSLILLIGPKHPEELFLDWLELVVIDWASLVVGMYMGPWAMKLAPGWMQKALNYLHKVDEGTADPLSDIKKGFNNTMSKHENKWNQSATPAPAPASASNNMKPDPKPEEKTDNRTPQQKMNDAAEKF